MVFGTLKPDTPTSFSDFGRLWLPWASLGLPLASFWSRLVPFGLSWPPLGRILASLWPPLASPWPPLGLSLASLGTPLASLSPPLGLSWPLFGVSEASLGIFGLVWPPFDLPWPPGQGKARQGKARQGKATQDQARQSKGMQGSPLSVCLSVGPSGCLLSVCNPSPLPHLSRHRAHRPPHTARGSRHRLWKDF